MSPGVPRVALVGDPVEASLSPAMHRAAFDALGMDWCYDAIRVPRGDLAAAWPDLAGRLAGLNVTVPLKQEVLPLVDELTPVARAAASVNTVVFGPRGALGDSTDGKGFLAAVEREAPGAIERAAVLGTGGAARAVAAALAGRGARVTVAGRNIEAGRRLVADLAAGGLAADRLAFIGWDPEPVAEAVAAADLVANATPVGGLADPLGDPLPEAVCLRRGTVVVDLVYRPRRTALLRRAADAGCRVVEGVEMLIEQGAQSFERWTGHPAPVAVMRAAAHRALAGDRP